MNLAAPLPARPKGCPPRGRGGFTLLELLVAVALVAAVAVVLGATLHQLTRAEELQGRRVAGPYAADVALHDLSLDLACAFAPPRRDTQADTPDGTLPEPPFSLEPAPSPVAPARIRFIAPERNAADHSLYAVLRLTAEVVPLPNPDPMRPADYEWRILSTPSAGPFTNSVTTNILYRGPWRAVFEALPPPPEAPDLPYDPTFLDHWPPVDLAPRRVAGDPVDSSTNAPPPPPRRHPRHRSRRPPHRKIHHPSHPMRHSPPPPRPHPKPQFRFRIIACSPPARSIVGYPR